MPDSKQYARTRDQRYFVVRGRLWRSSNPELPGDERERLVHELMMARSALRGAAAEDQSRIRAQIDRAKRALGERGPVWWNDGAPDYNRHLAKNTPYARWWAEQQE